jgi:hypothetical protein
MNWPMSVFSRSLWSAGVAFLVIGSLLVSEQSAFADPGEEDAELCHSYCSAQLGCDQAGEDGSLGDAYTQCMEGCTGVAPGIWCLACTRPMTGCPASGINVICVANICTGRCCPSTCKCYAKNSNSCWCAKGPTSP